MQAEVGHILVVDDDPLNRRLLTKSLENDGHRRTDLENGFAALSTPQSDRPDVGLLGIVMSGLDGIEVLERMKADEELHHIPVIMISGATTRTASSAASGPEPRTISPSRSTW